METLYSLFKKSDSFFKPRYTSQWINKNKPSNLQKIFLDNANKSRIFTSKEVIDDINEFIKDKFLIKDYINNILTNKPLSFYSPDDRYFFLTKQNDSCYGQNGLGNLFLSPEEIRFSSYLQFSSPVTPYNNGHCPNDGILGEHIEHAICISTPYIRFDVPGKYDYYILENGIINIEKYKNRVDHILFPFFSECDKRGEEYNMDVYIHIENMINKYGMKDRRNLGIQHDIFQTVINDILEKNNFTNISIINMNNMFNKNKISFKNIKFSKNNNPFSKSEDKIDKLVIVMCPIGSNSIIGNEYWCDQNTSFESSIALSTQITQLQNPFINSNINGNNIMSY